MRAIPAVDEAVQLDVAAARPVSCGPPGEVDVISGDHAD
jgi:hypothetical protein